MLRGCTPTLPRASPPGSPMNRTAPPSLAFAPGPAPAAARAAIR